MEQPIWHPSNKRIADSNMQQFLRRKNVNANNYHQLYEWSIERPDQFWGEFAEFSGILFGSPYEKVVENMEQMPGAQWFKGCSLNYAANLLKSEYTGTAIIFYGERGERIELTWSQLRDQVASISKKLRDLGIKPGDRVAGYLPNRPETVIAMLATTSIGGIWSSCSPDLGISSTVDRFGQIKPKVLFATDGYFYNGKTINSLISVAEIVKRLPTLKHLVIVAYVNDIPDIRPLSKAILFRELLEEKANLKFEHLPFNHPLCILYSSGTTSSPKCIVHGAGGTLIQHQKEQMLHTDIKPGDKVFYFTTCGWMMWNWLISTLASGATVILFDGSPFYPNAGVLWKIAERERLTVFGTSAKYLGTLEKAHYNPRQHVELNYLKSILSTGSPLAPSSFDFVYNQIKGDLQLSSISGGTDIISCFALGNPVLPVYRGELQCRGLGMKMEIFDNQGRSIKEKKGELVCTATFPSMPIGFWNDPDGEKYFSTYFKRFPNVWCHGDYAEITGRKSVIIHGRSDTVLNPGGVRIGTGEIYRVVDQFKEIEESVAIGQEWEEDERIVLFVRLQSDFKLDKKLTQEIRKAIREAASPRHVPAKILAVPDIPRTINGKVVEIAVRDMVHGKKAGNADALANPEALKHFLNRKELS